MESKVYHKPIYNEIDPIKRATFGMALFEEELDRIFWLTDTPLKEVTIEGLISPDDIAERAKMITEWTNNIFENLKEGKFYWESIQPYVEELFLVRTRLVRYIQDIKDKKVSAEIFQDPKVLNGLVQYKASIEQLIKVFYIVRPDFKPDFHPHPHFVNHEEYDPWDQRKWPDCKYSKICKFSTKYEGDE